MSRGGAALRARTVDGTELALDVAIMRFAPSTARASDHARTPHTCAIYAWRRGSLRDVARTRAQTHRGSVTRARNACANHRRGGYAVASGSVNENSEPSPGLLATRICPPWASTMPLAIASPRPAPPFLVRPCQ